MSVHASDIENISDILASCVVKIGYDKEIAERVKNNCLEFLSRADSEECGEISDGDFLGLFQEFGFRIKDLEHEKYKKISYARKSFSNDAPIQKILNEFSNIVIKLAGGNGYSANDIYNHTGEDKTPLVLYALAKLFNYMLRLDGSYDLLSTCGAFSLITNGDSDAGESILGNSIFSVLIYANGIDKPAKNGALGGRKQHELKSEILGIAESIWQEIPTLKVSDVAKAVIPKLTGYRHVPGQETIRKWLSAERRKKNHQA